MFNQEFVEREIEKIWESDCKIDFVNEYDSDSLPAHLHVWLSFGTGHNPYS